MNGHWWRPKVRSGYLTIFLAAASAITKPAALQAGQGKDAGHRETSPIPIDSDMPDPGPCTLQGTQTTVVQLTVTAKGIPTAESVAASSGSACLDKQALKTARTYRFRPAKRDGQPVAATMKIQVSFHHFG